MCIPGTLETLRHIQKLRKVPTARLLPGEKRRGPTHEGSTENDCRGEDEYDDVRRTVPYSKCSNAQTFNATRHNPTPNLQRHDFMRLYQLKLIEQYEWENTISLPDWKAFFQRKLRDRIMRYPTRSSTTQTEEFSLEERFSDSLTGMRQVHPRERWTPAKAKKHQFFSEDPLPYGQRWIPLTGLRRSISSPSVHIATQIFPTPPTRTTYAAHSHRPSY